MYYLIDTGLASLVDPRHVGPVLSRHHRDETALRANGRVQRERARQERDCRHLLIANDHGDTWCRAVEVFHGQAYLPRPAWRGAH